MPLTSNLILQIQRLGSIIAKIESVQRHFYKVGGKTILILASRSKQNRQQSVLGNEIIVEFFQLGSESSERTTPMCQKVYSNKSCVTNE
mmetsp:Transcript_35405/g.40991  ORF Transcript_35405/g.40991 Transcript_35405/m.40991 type:complete len:89 (+) Transcript_35405:257-523(+)